MASPSTASTSWRRGLYERSDQWTVAVVQSAGGFTPLATSSYTAAIRTDIQVSLDRWERPAELAGDPDLETTYPGAIAAKTDGSGDWSLSCPGQMTPRRRSSRVAHPCLVSCGTSSIRNPATGKIVYVGATPASRGGQHQNIMELTTLFARHLAGGQRHLQRHCRWGRVASYRCRSPRRALRPASSFRISAAPRGSSGTALNQTTRAQLSIRPTSSAAARPTRTGRIRLSDLPPAGKTVLVHVEVYLDAPPSFVQSLPWPFCLGGFAAGDTHHISIHDTRERQPGTCEPRRVSTRAARTEGRCWWIRLQSNTRPVSRGTFTAMRVLRPVQSPRRLLDRQH